MADQITQDEAGRTFKNGVLQTSSTLDPSNPIHNMISALASAFAPKTPGAAQLSGRGRQIDSAVDAASGAPLGDALGP